MRYSREIVLKNGEKCLLRNLETADAAAEVELFLRTHGETDYLKTYPDEGFVTPEVEANLIEEMVASPNAIEVGAFIGGVLVGSAGIEPVGTKEKVRHRAGFGISVERAHWGLGIGRALTEACVDCARAAGFAQLELEVVADNVAALALYRSVGFIEFGRNPLAFMSRLTGPQEIALMRMELR